MSSGFVENYWILFLRQSRKTKEKDPSLSLELFFEWYAYKCYHPILAEVI